MPTRFIAKNLAHGWCSHTPTGSQSYVWLEPKNPLTTIATARSDDKKKGPTTGRPILRNSPAPLRVTSIIIPTAATRWSSTHPLAARLMLGMRRPVRPHVSSHQAAAGTHHPRP